MNSLRDTGWSGSHRPRVPGGRRFQWSTLLWALVYPQRRHRVMPTASGVVLIALAFGIGTAAYNAANNILFITLSLLLACLVLSGVLSWLNFRGVEWQLRVSPPLRAGQVAVATLLVRNTKRVLPTYGLWFDLNARMVEQLAPGKAESTFTARGVDVREALARAEQVEAKERLGLRMRLDPGQTVQLEWSFLPRRRGVMRIQLDSVGSLFPFGFLQKQISAKWEEGAIVWPQPVDFRRATRVVSRRRAGAERAPRAGGGADLLALRRYAQGDSHRAIHWKASARVGELLVRQFAAESAEGFALWLRIDRAIWTRPEQFELLLQFVATLAEDLFRTGKLLSVAVDTRAPLPVRRVRDIESFLDELALIEPVQSAARSAGASVPPAPSIVTAPGAAKNVIAFAPVGPRGVGAWVDGELLASV